ncbi:trichoplein keratin filament-binding protein-like [Centruroides vittatus]|uniref:trichoplein keratin filament-binding protein-like n=1 Tax=Centruroides vittatus TaxID=120091 RepID=UPI00350EAAB2
MASSSLSSYWLSRNRKDLAEQAIVAKREQEVQRLKHWNEVSEHYRKADLRSSVHSALISTIPPTSIPKANVESAKQELESESKKKALEIRRADLLKLLKDEEQKFKMEMEEKIFTSRKTDHWNIEEMKKELEKLQNLRKEEIEKNINKTRDKEISFMNELKICKQQESTEADLEELRQCNKYVEELEIYLEELNKHEKEIQLLKDEELTFIKKEQQINELREKYYQMKDFRKKKEISIAMMKKSKNRLRQKALDIENELKFHQQMLDFLFKQKLQIEEAENEELFSNIKKLNNILEEQKRVEKEHQRELHLLYDEEAERIWKSREDEWNKDREARESIMNKILKELMRKIQEAIKKNITRRKEKLQKTDLLMKELMYLRNKVKEEKQIVNISQFQKHLETQIENRLSKYEEEKRQIEEEVARIKLLEVQERAFLEEEG